MSKRYVSKEVNCPFYHSESRQKIYCEGLKDGTAIHVAFASPAQMQDYKDIYCCDDFGECRIADMLYRKYEENDG